jgi:hypothetical protein
VCNDEERKRGRGTAGDVENKVGLRPALVARDQTRLCCPDAARIGSVDSRRRGCFSFSLCIEFWMLTIRTERGVGLRPMNDGS